MTGDGVNDLLALKEADCSISVGQGSDAARQTAQLVLLDSDFAVLKDVLLEGRRVVHNVTRSAGVFFIKTLYSILLCVLCLLTNTPFPFVPIQITLIDLVIEGYPSFFLSFLPDSRPVRTKFLPEAIRRAAPNALAIGVCFLFYYSTGFFYRQRFCLKSVRERMDAVRIATMANNPKNNKVVPVGTARCKISKCNRCCCSHRQSAMAK